jgi:hypothetical protein
MVVCNTKRVHGRAVSYRSNPGFVGTDTVEYDRFIAGGALLHLKVDVIVK